MYSWSKVGLYLDVISLLLFIYVTMDDEIIQL